MARFAIGGKRFFLLSLLALLLAGLAVAWAERKALLSWYYLHKLASAEGDDAGKWASRAAGMGDRIVPDLVEMLGSDDPRKAANAGRALGLMADARGRDDARLVELTGKLTKAFPRLGPAGRSAVFELAATWIAAEGPCPPALAEALGQLLPEAAHAGDAETHTRGLDLALGVLRHSKQPGLLCPAREIAVLCLRSPDVQTRVRAVHLARMPGLDLCKDVVPLLRDSAPEVRRAAMLAVGPLPQIIDTDALLPWLHDPDPEVRRLCEEALLEDRQLQPHHLRLAKLIADPRWSVRLEVIDHLHEADDLDAVVWLHRLSHDPSPTVRVAAIRTACASGLTAFRKHIDEMSREDPSPEVRDLARRYLNKHKPLSLAD